MCSFNENCFYVGGNFIYECCWDLVEKHDRMLTCAGTHVKFFEDILKHLVCNVDV